MSRRPVVAVPGWFVRVPHTPARHLSHLDYLDALVHRARQITQEARR